MEAEVESKICTSCKTEKPFSEYGKHPKYKNGLRSMCKECCNKAAKERYKKCSLLDRQGERNSTGAEIKSKICTRCGEEKVFEDYHKNRTKKYGVRPECKECSSKERKEYYKNLTPLERQIENMAGNLLNRTRGHAAKKHYYDKGIRCKIGRNRTEVKEYLREHFSDDIAAMIARGEQVSVDRIDSAGHYEAGNIQILELSLNAKKGSVVANKSASHAVLIEDTQTGEITGAISQAVAAEIVGCSYQAISYHIKHNSAPIHGRYKITKE